MSLLRFDPQGYIYYNGNYLPGYQPVSNSNPDLEWEKKSEFDIGFDFTLFKSRLSGSFDFYTNATTDLLNKVNVPVPPNFYNYAWINMGKIKNSGVELTLNYNVIKKSDFSYSLTFTSSLNSRSTLVSMSGSYNGAKLTYGTVDIGDMGSPGMCCTPLVRSEEGKPVGQLLAFVYKGIDQNGNLILEDQYPDGQIDQRDRAIVGNGLPESLLGLGNMVTYKNWDLDVFFRSVSGHDLVNSYRSFYEVPNLIQTYNLPETTANMKNASTGVYLKNSSGVLTSIDVEHASFISLDNISLGYSFILPGSSQFSKIRMYLGSNNLFYITRYKGSDPNPRYIDNEQLGTLGSPLVPGIDRRNNWPRTRSFTFGANVVF
jgi:iron complex outermembrane receptor protein